MELVAGLATGTSTITATTTATAAILAVEVVVVVVEEEFGELLAVGGVAAALLELAVVVSGGVMGKVVISGFERRDSRVVSGCRRHWRPMGVAGIVGRRGAGVETNSRGGMIGPGGGSAGDEGRVAGVPDDVVGRRGTDVVALAVLPVTGAGAAAVGWEDEREFGRVVEFVHAVGGGGGIGDYVVGGTPLLAITGHHHARPKTRQNVKETRSNFKMKIKNKKIKKIWKIKNKK